MNESGGEYHWRSDWLTDQQDHWVPTVSGGDCVCVVECQHRSSSFPACLPGLLELSLTNCTHITTDLTDWLWCGVWRYHILHGHTSTIIIIIITIAAITISTITTIFTTINDNHHPRHRHGFIHLVQRVIRNPFIPCILQHIGITSSFPCIAEPSHIIAFHINDNFYCYYQQQL